MVFLPDKNVDCKLNLYIYPCRRPLFVVHSVSFLSPFQCASTPFVLHGMVRSLVGSYSLVFYDPPPQVTLNAYCGWLAGGTLSLVSVFPYFDRGMVWLPLLVPLFLAGLTRVESLNYGYGSQPRAQRSDDPTEEWLQQWQQVHDHHLCPPCKSSKVHDHHLCPLCKSFLG